MTRRAAALLPAILAATLACSDVPSEPILTPDAGTWATWVLPRGDALRPAAPPSDTAAATRSELDEIVGLQRARTAATDSLVRLWDGDPTARWTGIALDLLDFYWPLLPDVRTATPVRAARIMALVHVAMYDAVIAAWDAKYAYGRRAPARASGRVAAWVPLDDTPGYPSELAAVAAATADILAYAFPVEDSAALVGMAREAGESRVRAGAAYRTDVEAGWALGRAVAERVLARARGDGSDQEWTGQAPQGPEYWKPTPVRRTKVPFDPLAGGWRTWVLPAGNAHRLAPPPPLGSAEFEADLNELRALSRQGRTEAQVNAARFWATEAPSTHWERFVDQEVARHALNVPRAARARALVSVAMYDAFVACWDTKYAYWLARPITIDTTLATLFSTPPFPAYPSGHSTVSMAAAQVMAELFPDVRKAYLAKAEEASLSRVWAAIHYRFDVVSGDSLGAKIGRAVVAKARTDGSEK
ncbi:MAG: phosphatase PAP2 family protein [Gemmatimonadetes bacterium]|nr:phosphatase PAP2 family protein [Gemmatimonadota bacterium]